MVGDGSAMYTLQSLWTQAREGLDVTTIVFSNRSYQILKGEFAGVDAGEPGQKALAMLNLDNPALDWVSLAKGMGVSGRSVTTADEFNLALAEAIKREGSTPDRSRNVIPNDRPTSGRSRPLVWRSRTMGLSR